MIAAFVLVNCHFPFDTRIMDEISKIPSVTHVYRTEGRYDLMVKINAETENKLIDMISRDVNAIHGVDATLTMIIA
jgi:DNA-binding Lrp family transcriptional regulator